MKSSMARFCRHHARCSATGIDDVNSAAACLVRPAAHLLSFALQKAAVRPHEFFTILNSLLGSFCQNVIQVALSWRFYSRC
jgi:hypothetical protein